MPRKGYTSLFSNMIKNKNIEILLNTDYSKIKDKIKPKLATIYTGPPDTFFNNKFGKLDWRSLDFKFKNFKKDRVQECVQINYPNNYKFTRKVHLSL